MSVTLDCTTALLMRWEKNSHGGDSGIKSYNEYMVELMAGVWNLETGIRFCAGAFCRNLISGVI